MKKWSIRKADMTKVELLCAETGLSPLIGEVLVARGISDREKTDAFFLPQELSDPYLIEDMDKAVSLIENHLEKGDQITIFGDFDCDGVTSTVILYQYLEALGGEVDWYIPHRNEGYGMNIPAIDAIAKKGVSLIITVDNGISAYEEIKYAKSLGLNVIVTDHHQPPEMLPPADAIVNPHTKGNPAPFKDFAGCGVVLKLVMALEKDNDVAIHQFADLAALGTVADIVPLVGENRTIVKCGLQNMANTANLGLRRLLSVSGIDEERLNAVALAFAIAPRINAAGRIAHAGQAMDMFLSEDYEFANFKAGMLSEFNDERQQTESKIMAEAEEYLYNNPIRLYDRVLIAVGKNWHHGIVGIVAAKLLNKYDKPVIVISIEENTARGSARSIDGFSIYKALSHCKGHLTKFGGHSKAGGFSLHLNELDNFINGISEYAHLNHSEMPHNTFYIDKEITPLNLTVDAIEQLALLEPYGESNPAPIFLMKNCKILSKKPLKEGKYLSLIVDFNGTTQKILQFSMSYDDFWYSVGDVLDLVVTLSINEYNDKKNISIIAKDVRRCNFKEDKYFSALHVYEKLQRGERTDPKLYKRIIPEMNEIKIVYDILKKENKLAAIADLAIKNGVNYCMMLVILDLFFEFNLVSRDFSHSRIELLPSKEKADFAKSEYIAKLRSIIV